MRGGGLAGRFFRRLAELVKLLPRGFRYAPEDRMPPFEAAFRISPPGKQLPGAARLAMPSAASEQLPDLGPLLDRPKTQRSGGKLGPRRCVISGNPGAVISASDRQYLIGPNGEARSARRPQRVAFPGVVFVSDGSGVWRQQK